MYNWLNYQTVLKKVKAPIFFYLAVFLCNITFIEDRNRNFCGKSIINFEKVVLMGMILMELENYQKYNYLKLITPK
jgi:hypothetical protein